MTDSGWSGQPFQREFNTFERSMSPVSGRGGSRPSSPSARSLAGGSESGGRGTSAAAAQLATDLYKLADRARGLQFADEERDRLAAELKIVHMGHRAERERLEREIGAMRVAVVERDSRISDMTTAVADESERLRLKEYVKELQERLVGADRLAAQGVRAARVERDQALQEKAQLQAELEGARTELGEAKKQLPLISLMRSDRDRLADDLSSAMAQVRELEEQLTDVRRQRELSVRDASIAHATAAQFAIRAESSRSDSDLAAAISAASDAELTAERAAREVLLLRAKLEAAVEGRQRAESELAALRADAAVNEAAARALGPLRSDRDRLAAELRALKEHGRAATALAEETSSGLARDYKASKPASNGAPATIATLAAELSAAALASSQYGAAHPSAR